MIADAKFIRIFTFDLILRHERRQKDLSDNEDASIYRRNMDIGAIDRDAVLSGKLGEEIMSLGASGGTTSLLSHNRLPSVLSLKGATGSVSGDVVLENPRYFMLTERMDSVAGGSTSKTGGASMQ